MTHGRPLEQQRLPRPHLTVEQPLQVHARRDGLHVVGRQHLALATSCGGRQGLHVAQLAAGRADACIMAPGTAQQAGAALLLLAAHWRRP
jgi:hypothetical protein